MERTNELNHIIIFINKFLDNVDDLHRLLDFESISVHQFYTKIFCDNTSEKIYEIDLIKFTELKTDYVKVIDKIILKIMNHGGRNEKAIAELRKLQEEIAKLDFDADREKVGKVKKNFLEYKNRLEIYEEIYENTYGNYVVDVDELQKIRKELQELIEDINASKIDSKFKQVILNSLLNMQYYLEKYYIFGIDGISESLERVTGSMLLNCNQTQMVTEVEEKIGKKILSLIKNVNAVVTLAKNVIGIAADIDIPLLEGLFK